MLCCLCQFTNFSRWNQRINTIGDLCYLDCSYFKWGASLVSTICLFQRDNWEKITSRNIFQAWAINSWMTCWLELPCNSKCQCLPVKWCLLSLWASQWHLRCSLWASRWHPRCSHNRHLQNMCQWQRWGDNFKILQSCNQISVKFRRQNKTEM